MQSGNNWSSTYSRFSYNESKYFYMMLKEKGVPVLDDEFNVSQEILLTLLRRCMHYTLGDGSADTGFKPFGTSNRTNDFDLKAGTYFIDGWYLNVAADFRYSTQPISQPTLATPSGNRTDEIYLDVWYDEVTAIADNTIVDPTLGTDTSHRLKLYWTVKVAQGTTTPVSYTDANNLPHWTQKIGHINRTATATITDPMINDDRRIILGGSGGVTSSIGQVAFFAMTSAPTGWLVNDGTNVSRATYSKLFSTIGTTFGAGDGSTTFTLPKLNDGKFIRTWNNTGVGHDAGRVFGSTQQDSLINHKHIQTWGENGFVTNPNVGRPNTTFWGTGPAPFDNGCIGAASIIVNGTTFQCFDWDQAWCLTSPPYDAVNFPPNPIGNTSETMPYNISLLSCIKAFD